MGSTTPPDCSLSHQTSSATSQSSTNTTITLVNNTYEERTIPELRNLLQERDQEIQALKYELDKYKLALQQSQLNCHFVQEQLEKHRRLLTTTITAAIASTSATQSNGVVVVGSNVVDTRTTNDDSGVIQDDQQTSNDILALSSSADHHQIISSSTPKRAASSGRSSKVLFKTGDDDSEADEQNIDDLSSFEQELSSMGKATLSKSEENLEDNLHDVGSIDLDQELSRVASRKSSVGVRSQSMDENEVPEPDQDDDEDIISDELLTSLTEAAMSNLSQLAALQEQCESQQQHPQNQYQNQGNGKQSSNLQQQQMSCQQSSHSSSICASPEEQSTAATPISPQNIANPLRLLEHRQSKTIDFAQDPFSSVSISNQAAIAISRAAAAAAAASAPAISTTSSSINIPTSCNTPKERQQLVSSSSSSMSPNSTIQSDLNTTSHSLASVVAAAAVAAAAANDQHQQQQHSHLNPNNNNHPQSRIVSSALPHTQDYYHALHNQHQQQHLGSPLSSALSSLHFSPSTSVTPSPCSLIGTSQLTRRSTQSNASSSIVSPTALPGYLRRQFMPSSDRLPSMSPSPSSGLATGSSSGASSSLAQILHHHHHQSQQRSVSALAGGSISSSSPGGITSPLSGTGSNAVSPLLANKNSSQARLNNMQIRHKFGYLGSGKAQFNSPHGFCLGLNQEIVVADTNNHRVCIFDKSGTYITQFGSPGKEEGQLWNPRKVAILHRPIQGGSNATGTRGGISSSNQNFPINQRIKSSAALPYSSALPDQSSGQLVSLNNSEPLYVVCDRGAERSRMQLFTKDGAFIKKIGIHYIDIVAGLAITQNGLIIVVDSVSPTVYIINGETGVLNGWFDCSGYMKEPSDIAVKSDVPGNEYFICDFKGHCVVVFNEQGEYLRKIGHDGLTSYPNGIDISDDGDILVGDSHGNRFHVVVFDRNGNFVSQFECPHVKVSRCCGLKITREGYIVTLAKNNHHVLVLDTIHI